MKKWSLVVSAALLASLTTAGCGEETPARDAGPADAGLDAADLDASGVDAGGTDAAVDAGSCPVGEVVCAGGCVNRDTSVLHCGTCDHACPVRPNAEPACAAGSCEYPCLVGFADCNGSATDGCEIETATSLSNCGMCGMVCPDASGGSPTCSMGMCGLTCDVGFGDCDHTTTTGCEVDTRSTLAHCGMCDNVCPVRAHSEPACALGMCRVTCDAGFGDCDASEATGCEVDTRVTAAHCGMCRNACPSRANASANCAASACGFSCDAGFQDCNGSAGDGCEADLSSRTNCGICGRVCSATADCIASLCGVVGPARPLAPISLGYVTSRRPTFRWALGSNSDGARVQVCSSRACSTVLATFTGSTSAAPSSDLPTGILYWRLFGRHGTYESPTSSVVWELHVSPHSAPVSSSYGALLDVNGDGYADVAIGAHDANPLSMANAGTVTVHLGSASGLAASVHRTLVGSAAEDSFGASVASAGDVDGDGFGDLVVGAPLADPGGRVSAGAAYVYFGSATGLGTTPAILPGPMAGDVFGSAVAGGGDVNRDGYADILVGAPNASRPGVATAGVVMVFLGHSTGIAPLAIRTYTGAAGDRLGTSVASAGDVNGDGYSDVIVGARFADGTAGPTVGEAQIYHGSATGLGATAARVLEGAATGDSFAHAVACAGDVNGDGYTDVIIGVPSATVAGAVSGIARVYLGSATGIAATVHRTYSGLGPGEFFGGAVSSARDVNGDGFDDVVIGASSADPGGLVGAGNAVVYVGSSSGLAMLPLRRYSGGAAGDSYGGAVSGIGDVNGDGEDDLAIGAELTDPGGLLHAGSAYIYHGSTTGLPPAPTRTYDAVAAYDRFGSAIAW